MSPLAIVIAVIVLLVIVALLWYIFMGRKPAGPGTPGAAPATGPYDGTGAPPSTPPPDGVPVAPGRG